MHIGLKHFFVPIETALHYRKCANYFKRSGSVRPNLIVLQNPRIVLGLCKNIKYFVCLAGILGIFSNLNCKIATNRQLF